MRNLLFILLALIFFNCQPKTDLPIKFSLNENWYFKGVDTLKWQKASVPGNVFTDLLSHKIIKNPFIKTNEDSVQWVSKKDWEYKTSFTLTEEILNKENIELKFDGLDSYASIYINDSLIGTTNNAFRTWSINIKKNVKPKNELKVIFKNFDEIETKKEQKNPYKLPEGKRVYTRKAQFQYGWDWGPKINTSGIWKDVSINAWDNYKIENIYIKNNSITDSLANISVYIEDKASNIDFVKYYVYVNDVLQPVHTEKPEIPITIKNPKLWWTHNLGEPYLYDIKVVVKKNDVILDSISSKYGIRDIKLINEKDSIGESFYFKLNGNPVYMKGANYIPQNSFQNNVTNQHYIKLISDTVDANMNMLRVWGGGIYENDIFYDLCDEKGILVWQDFMFACAMYPGDSEFLANVKEEAEQQVKRLRNHASIALWCGNNENSEGWKRWGWQANRTSTEKEEIWNDYLVVFDSILPNIVHQNSTTDYWETSPKYGRGNPKYKTEGDAHDWWIWHDAYPFEHLQNNVPRFMSEFGFQSFPSYEVINYINQKDSIYLKTVAIKSHQKHGRGFQLIEEYMASDYKIPANDEDYVYVSQLLQAKGIVIGIEAQRRTKPYNMGTLFWQLNDCWPAISWSSIDYFGNWKALHFKAKKAYENVLISTVASKYDYDTYIINDSFKELNDTLQLKVIDFYGKEIWSNSKVITIQPNSSEKVYQIPQVDIYKADYEYLIEFGKSKSTYFFDKPKNLALLKGEIQQKIKKTKKGIQIILKSDVLQKDVFLYSKQEGYFSDNYFDLIPNQEKIIFFNSNKNEEVDFKIKSLNQLNY